jgi:hypothetical protein
MEGGKLLCLGLVFVKIDPFFESSFFIGFVTFILIYMIMLIRDLDDPFEYDSETVTDEVSLHPLTDLQERLGVFK